MKGARRSDRAAPPGPASAPVARARGDGGSPLGRVRKRDGREVPFDRTKIRDAIAAAMDAVGDDDPVFADEVAGVVELALRDRVADAGGSHVPQIEEIQDLVERALMELGRAAVAKAYILYRDRRARLREALSVHERARGPLRVRESEGVRPWSKGRIVAALLSEAELARPEAEEVAAAVERRVFASGWKRISTGLVRELVASELFERGWTRALRRQEAIGLGRADLRALLRGEPLAPWERGAAEARGTDAGGELVARYALEDVLPEEIAELHRAGDLSLEDLRRADRPLALSVEAALLAGGQGPEAPWRLLERAAELARGLGGVLSLEDPGALLANLAEGLDGLALRRWLGALASVARAGGVTVELVAGGRGDDAWAGPVVDALAGGLADGAPGLRLLLPGPAIEGLLAGSSEREEALERLLATGRLWSTWSESDASVAGAGCQRLPGERGAIACLGACALNLPRLARRAGPWREELFQAGLVELVRAAVEAAGRFRAFQERSAATRSLGLHTRASFALTAVGLREALAVLGDGTPDPEQGARLLGLLAEAADRFGAERSVPLVVTPFFGARAARRLAWLDAERAADDGGRQTWLFAEAQEGGELAYSHGLSVAPGAHGAGGLPPGRAEAAALRTLRAGAFAPAELAGPGAAGTPLEAAPGARPLVSAWKRFELMRRTHAGEIELELFPVPRRPARPSMRPAPLRPLP